MYHCFRLHRGDDLYESIQRYADAHHIAAGVVLSAVGCVYRWELRDASGVDVQSGTEDVEIVSLMGTVSEHGSHLHASLARRDLSVFGGHLRPGCLVNTTAEIGRMLKVPTNTVLSWLRRARAQLQTMLKEEIEDEVV